MHKALTVLVELFPSCIATIYVATQLSPSAVYIATQTDGSFTYSDLTYVVACTYINEYNNNTTL